MDRRYCQRSIRNILKVFCSSPEENVVEIFNAENGRLLRAQMVEQLIGTGILLNKMQKKRGGLPASFEAPVQELIPYAKCYEPEKFFNPMFGLEILYPKRLLELYTITMEHFIKADMASTRLQ
jgi:hypothetical protein